MMTDEQRNKRLELTNLIKEPLIFEFEEELYNGNPHTLIRDYVLENSSKDFRTWLIDQGLRLHL